MSTATSSSDPKTPAMGYPATSATNGVGVGVGVSYPYPASQPPPPPAAAAAAAYYYAPHPPPAVAAPPPYYPSYANPNPGPLGPTTTLLRRLIAVGVALILLLGAATFVVWLVLRPRMPVVSVSSFSVSHFNLSSSLLSGDFDVALSFSNPNTKLSVSFSSPLAALSFSGAAIAETSLPPFFQPKQNSTTIRFRLAASDDYVDPGAASDIAASLRSASRTVRFQVRFFALAVFRSGGWRTRRHAMPVYCDDVPVAFSNANSTSGQMPGPPRRCVVSL